MTADRALLADGTRPDGWPSADGLTGRIEWGRVEPDGPVRHQAAEQSGTPRRENGMGASQGNGAGNGERK